MFLETLTPVDFLTKLRQAKVLELDNIYAQGLAKLEGFRVKFVQFNNEHIWMANLDDFMFDHKSIYKKIMYPAPFEFDQNKWVADGGVIRVENGQLVVEPAMYSEGLHSIGVALFEQQQAHRPHTLALIERLNSQL